MSVHFRIGCFDLFRGLPFFPLLLTDLVRLDACERPPARCDAVGRDDELLPLDFLDDDDPRFPESEGEVFLVFGGIGSTVAGLLEWKLEGVVISTGFVLLQCFR
jgi:hypothetical protein